MAQDKLTHAERTARKQARAEAREAKAAEKARITAEVELERIACLSAIRLPAAHQAWGATRIRAWTATAAACASTAKRKKVTPAELAAVRTRLENVGTMPLESCANIVFGR